MEENTDSAFVVIGGGIAGVTCVETLSALVPDEKVLLVTSSDLIKAVTNYKKLSRALETFDVEERPNNQVEVDCPNVRVLKTEVTALDSSKHELFTSDVGTIGYGKLCICSGARPKMITKDYNKFIIGIRDTESVEVFQKKLKDARRILVVGNGGIATELVYEIEGCEVLWAIKDKSISATFVDGGAAEFFLPHLNEKKGDMTGSVKRLKYTQEKMSDSMTSQAYSPFGGALGPDWTNSRHISGNMKMCHHVVVEYCVEVDKVITPSELQQAGCPVTEPFHKIHNPTTDNWPVYVLLTNGRVYGCDFIVSATGVVPNTQPFLTDKQLKLSGDCGIEVNQHMETSLTDVYAAGDVCTAAWDHSEHWLQMRLWSQARQMGCYAAKCMVAAVRQEHITLDFCFEMFAHVTKFFNFKVVLLGKFNAQGLGQDYELLLRVTKGQEYVKVILQNGRLKGAILIGETDMEETFENLILNGMDLMPFKEHLLDCTVDIEDFFD